MCKELIDLLAEDVVLQLVLNGYLKNINCW